MNTTTLSVSEFNQDDQAYLRWLDMHPAGFVVNTTRGKSSHYLILHRATCKSISQYTKMARPGGFTERDFIKICSDDINALSAWIRQNISNIIHSVVNVHGANRNRKLCELHRIINYDAGLK